MAANMFGCRHQHPVRPVPPEKWLDQIYLPMDFDTLEAKIRSRFCDILLLQHRLTPDRLFWLRILVGGYNITEPINNIRKDHPDR